MKPAPTDPIMRTFIAIELPEEIRSALAALQDQLKASGADVKWVEPQNIHLTLKFLGNIDDALREKIGGALCSVAANNQPFMAVIGLCGAFPNMDYPRVIWLGITEGEPQIKKIAREIEDKISGLGIEKDARPFTGHITIGRVRSPSGKKSLTRALADQAQNLVKLNLGFSVSKLTLFKSTLSPAGPVYVAQKEENLKIS